ncbi:MAG: nucleotide exchange factor GrpE [Clostridia bacterium]|nr:nucleotide exchange factor GrpE [Clostridia bacterium]
MEETKKDVVSEEEQVAPEVAAEEVDPQVAELQKQLAQAQDQYQRVLAEYANYKRRTDQEKEQLGAFVKGEALKALLPGIDNLERAITSPDGPEYRKGVEMVIRQFVETLTALGLEEIPAQGEVFDPELHNAVMREDADGVEPETVTEVYQKGYRLSGRVLRPAMVKVAN